MTRRPDLPVSIARRVDALRDLINVATDFHQLKVGVDTFDGVRADAVSVLGSHWLATADREMEGMGWDASVVNKIGESWDAVADLVRRIDHAVAYRQNRRLDASRYAYTAVYGTYPTP